MLYYVQKDYSGLIDGTHVPVVVPAEKQILYIGRKRICTQNILLTCFFGMRFPFVVAGWEWMKNDSRIMTKAIKI